MSNVQQKIEAIIAKNGIKSFGCCFEDLEGFTEPEIAYLDDRGLIPEGWATRMKMRREFAEYGKMENRKRGRV